MYMSVYAYRRKNDGDDHSFAQIIARNLKREAFTTSMVILVISHTLPSCK